MLNKAIHIRCKKGQIANSVLLPGDPERSRMISRFFDEPAEIAHSREFLTFTGKTLNVPVSVTSTGVGCPSTSIAVEELANLGARNFIRVGTTGAIQGSINVGDVIIATAAVRGDGTSAEYAPLEYPAVATNSIVSALVEGCKEFGVVPHQGIIRTHDAFYRESPYAPKEYASRIDKWNKLGVLALDNESSALFVLGSLRKLATGTIMVVRGNLINGRQAEDIKEIQPRIETMITIALSAVRRLARNEGKG